MLPFLHSCIRKSSSQVFVDPSCNLLELEEIVPKEVIEHYMNNMSEKEQNKYKKRSFYKIQDKLRNLRPLDDQDILYLYRFNEDEKILLLQIASKAIMCLIEQIDL